MLFSSSVVLLFIFRFLYLNYRPCLMMNMILLLLLLLLILLMMRMLALL